MKGKTELLSHGMLLLSTLVMLLSVTVAWFIQNGTAPVTAMSFAAQNAGGATLYKTAQVTNRTVGKTETGVLTIANTVTWKTEPEPLESAEITISDMQPGQCEYYFILANAPTKVILANLEVLRDGDESTADLADCLGFYLQAVEGTAVPAPSAVTCSLVRREDPLAQTLTPLEAAALFGYTAGDIPLTGETVKSSAYILTILCDPQYGQEGETNKLAGSVKLSLQFDAVA